MENTELKQVIGLICLILMLFQLNTVSSLQTTTTTFPIIIVDLSSSNQIYDEDFSLESEEFIIYNFEITSIPSKLYLNISIDQDDGFKLFSGVLVSFVNQSAYDNWLSKLNSWGQYMYDNYRVKLSSSSNPYFTIESEGKYYVILYNDLNITATGHISLKNVLSISQITGFTFFPMVLMLIIIIVFIKRNKKREIRK